MQLELDTCVIDLQTGRISGAREGRLTPRELQLLRHLVDREGEAVSRDELMKVFGYNARAQSRAVDKAIHSLRGKVEASSAEPEHVVTVAGGYCLLRKAHEPEVVATGGRVPTERDSFVGRGAELDRLARHLESSRLLCVTGPAGVGKTRLVLRYLARASWPGGSWFCALADAQDQETIVFAVAQALGVVLARGDAVQQLGHALAARGRCLLVLDNLEQIVEPVRPLVERWLDLAPEATVLATSRIVLGLQGERLFELDVLPISEAVELFVARAEAAQEGFGEQHGQDAALPELVERLDGLPLAIELAAARARVLSPQELLERMSERFQLLEQRGRPSRQATLRGTFDWSWNLLEPWAADALAQLSVFEGGFDLQAVEAVLDLSAFEDAPWAPLALQGLVDRSWVRRTEPRRFALLVSVQEYAAEKLTPPARLAAETRHGLHFSSLGTDEALLALMRPGAPPRRARLARELDNLTVTQERAIARGDTEVATRVTLALWELLRATGPYTAMLTRLIAPLGLPLPPRARIQLLLRAGRGHHMVGQFGPARELVEEARALVRSCEEPTLEAEALFYAATLERTPTPERLALAQQALVRYREAGDLDGEALSHSLLGSILVQTRPREARDAMLQGLELQRRLGNRYAEGLLLNGLGVTEQTLGQTEEATAHLEKAWAVAREVGNRSGQGQALLNLAVLHKNTNRLEEASASLEQALELLGVCGERRTEVMGMTNLATVRRLQGRIDEALQLYGRALVLHEELGNTSSMGTTHSQLGSLHKDRGEYELALQHYRRAADLAERGADSDALALVLANMGITHRQAGRLAEAHVYMQRALAKAQDNGLPTVEGPVLAEWALVYADEGHFDEARSLLLESGRRLGTVQNPFLRARVLKLRAQLERRAQRPDLIEGVLDELEALRPQLGELEPELAELLAQRR